MARLLKRDDRLGAAQNEAAAAGGGPYSARAIAVPHRATPARRKPKPSANPSPAAGTFLSKTFTCPEGTLGYRFYTPKRSGRRRMPKVIMLHGCSQTVADPAAGTGLNSLADELGVLVPYPHQTTQANVGRC